MQTRRRSRRGLSRQQLPLLLETEQCPRRSRQVLQHPNPTSDLPKLRQRRRRSPPPRLRGLPPHLPRPLHPLALLTYPTRYAHSPIETVDEGDIRECVDLLVAFAAK